MSIKQGVGDGVPSSDPSETLFFILMRRAEMKSHRIRASSSVRVSACTSTFSPLSSRISAGYEPAHRGIKIGISDHVALCLAVQQNPPFINLLSVDLIACLRQLRQNRFNALIDCEHTERRAVGSAVKMRIRNKCGCPVGVVTGISVFCHAVSFQFSAQIRRPSARAGGAGLSASG